MARKTTKTDEIPEAKIRQVIWMLKDKPGKKPATKKECCEHLGIAYNTKRLDKIVTEFQEKEARELELKEKAKNKVFTEEEKSSIAEEYVNGSPVSKIAKLYHVTDYRIKKILKEKQVPIRGRGKNKPAKVEHIVQDFDKKLPVNSKIMHVPTSSPCIIMKVYDEDYADYLSEPEGEKFVRLLEPKYDKKTDSWDDREGVHYEVYWQYSDGSEIKRLAAQYLINSIYKHLGDNGREAYLLYKTEEDQFRYISANRESILPVEMR